VRDFFNDGGSYTLSIIAVTPEEMGAVEQGDLTEGEAVTGSLAEDETHAWTFDVDEPAEATIILASGPELDGFFVLFGPDGAILEIVDETLTGDEEQLTGYNLEETGEYTIVVGEYANGGGDYTLTLEFN
jgi:VCBS repeat-containing protein